MIQKEKTQELNRDWIIEEELNVTATRRIYTIDLKFCVYCDTQKELQGVRAKRIGGEGKKWTYQE